MIKAVIFDMDGVIVDTEPIYFEVDKDILARYGIKITKEDYLQYVGKTGSEFYGDMMRKHNKNTDYNEIRSGRYKQIEEAFAKGLQPANGLLPLLEVIKKKGIKIGVASSSTVERINFVLDLLGISDFFNAIMSGADVKNHKPEPDVYEAIAEKLGFATNDCVAIEDSQSGVLSAKAAGMKCIALLTEFSAAQDVSSADKTVNSLEEINVNKLDDL